MPRLGKARDANLPRPPPSAATWHTFYLGNEPFDILVERVKQRRDVSIREVAVGLLDELCVFSFAHGDLLLSNPPAEAGLPFHQPHNGTR